MAVPACRLPSRFTCVSPSSLDRTYALTTYSLAPEESVEACQLRFVAMERAPHDAAIRVTSEFAVEVDVSPSGPKRIRHDVVAGASLSVEFTEEDSTDTVKGVTSGAGQVSLTTASGSGTVWLRPEARTVTVFEIDEPLVLLDSEALIAADASITTAIGEKLDSTLRRARTAVWAWVLHGEGRIALGTRGQAQVVEVTPDEPLVVESGALVAYSESISLAEADDYRKNMASRGVKKLLDAGLDKLGVSLGANGSRQRVWVVAEGSGVVVLQVVVD